LLVKKNLEFSSELKRLKAKVNMGTNKITSDIEQNTNDSNAELYLSILENFEKLMDKEKLFLQKDLSLQLVAEKLGTNRTYLSEAINRHIKMSFSGYVNAYRVREAINYFAENRLHKLNMDGIADKVGFNNRFTLISAFKKETGLSPSVFVKNMNQEFNQ
jgi:YesN/AraC family two-component response regulator